MSTHVKVSSNDGPKSLKPSPPPSPKPLLSIVIPCYNEEEGLPSLAQQLALVLPALEQHGRLELVFVDDGSTDKTNALLHHYFGNHDFGKKTTVKILQHEKNKNLSAALKTGFAAAHGEFVAALDSDCTYSPRLLVEMIPLMNETDIVTVSPYHPEGKISNVAFYRIFLSRSASLLYRLLVSWNIYTYTAMVRMYRREVLQNIRFQADNFLGVTELLVRAVLNGYRVKDFPAELRVRQFGVSKMKVLPLKIIGSHLSLLFHVVLHRLRITKL